jgi:hypothetical protein
LEHIFERKGRNWGKKSAPCGKLRSESEQM